MDFPPIIRTYEEFVAYCKNNGESTCGVVAIFTRAGDGVVEQRYYTNALIRSALMADIVSFVFVNSWIVMIRDVDIL